MTVNKKESVTDPETEECVRKTDRKTERQSERESETERERAIWRSITQPDGRSGLSELEQWAEIALVQR